MNIEYRLYAMPTTITVKDETARMLQQLQRRLGTSTHDETIRALMNKNYPTNEFFGALKHVKTPFKREELDRFA